jgi:DmX-like protein
LSKISATNLQIFGTQEKKKKPGQNEEIPVSYDYMNDFGLFEASRIACPVLPQYHPKQLMELLNSGKIRWVKAILAHLVRCISGSCAVRGSGNEEESLSRQQVSYLSLKI